MRRNSLGRICKDLRYARNSPRGKTDQFGKRHPSLNPTNGAPRHFAMRRELHPPKAVLRGPDGTGRAEENLQRVTSRTIACASASWRDKFVKAMHRASNPIIFRVGNSAYAGSLRSLATLAWIACAAG